MEGPSAIDIADSCARGQVIEKMLPTIAIFVKFGRMNLQVVKLVF